MRFDGTDSRDHLVYQGDATVRNCGCAQAQCSTSVGQSGEIWRKESQENPSYVLFDNMYINYRNT